MEITRHFTATVFIYNTGRILLHKHKSLNLWLPPGGHVDRDELPQDCAVREVEEETGLTITLYNADKEIVFKDSTQLARPQHLILEDINPYHQHIDFIYFAKTYMNTLEPEASESQEMKWFLSEELDLEGVPDNVKVIGEEVIRLFSKE